MANAAHPSVFRRSRLTSGGFSLKASQQSGDNVGRWIRSLEFLGQQFEKTGGTVACGNGCSSSGFTDGLRQVIGQFGWELLDLESGIEDQDGTGAATLKRGVHGFFAQNFPCVGVGALRRECGAQSRRR